MALFDTYSTYIIICTMVNEPNLTLVYAVRARNIRDCEKIFREYCTLKLCKELGNYTGTKNSGLVTTSEVVFILAYSEKFH